MIPFKDYFWKYISQGVFISWLVLCGASILVYISLIIFLKDKQLTSSLNVAAYTVREAMHAGDWSLALGHLMKLEENGPVFHIKLSGSVDDRNNLTGPFGEKAFGIGTFCKVTPVSKDLQLNGCMRIFAAGEIITLFLFIILTCGIFLSTYKMFRSKMLFMIENISESLKNIRRLEVSEAQLEDSDIEEISEIISIREYIILLLKEVEEASKAVAVNHLSTQVAHDIRSPLTALDMVIKDLNNLPEEKRVLIRNAVTRIRDIANNLLKQYRKNETNLNKAPSIVISMLDVIVSEKRIQYSNRNIKFELLVNNQDCYSLFTDINITEFKRMISNIINNSVEAINDQGVIVVSLSKNQNNIIIEVKDTGCGIDDSRIDKFSRNIACLSKKGGHGLGLKHAYSLIKSHAGTIKILSKINHGTIVKIDFPAASIPVWFIDKIHLPVGGQVIIFDDDISIHEVWAQRFNKYIQQDDRIEVLHFTSISSLQAYLVQSPQSFKNYTFLIDYEILNSKATGLDIIEQMNLKNTTILVTSLYEESEIVKRCEKMGIYLLPKSMAAFIPIQIVNTYDAILIDDDPMIHTIWKIAAQKFDKQLRTYFSYDEFILDINMINLLSPIYIDVNLQNGMRGDELAKDMFSRGFKNVSLTTGYEKSEFLNVPWIKAVIGKEPPWSI